MDKWFNSKWFVRAVSFAFAILIYVFVNIEVTTTQSDSRIPSVSDEARTLNDVPVDIRIDSDRFVVSGVPEYVTVTLEGPTSTLTSTVMQRNFDLYVDLQGLEEGTHTVDIEHARVPDNLAIYIDPKTIEIRIEERASEEFDVSVDFINRDQLPDGYELGEPEINPDKVTITSSRSVIDQIAMVKVYIDAAGLTDPITNREVPVNVYDSQGNVLSVRIEPASVVVSVDVLNPSKTVPVNVSTTGQLPDGLSLLSIEPETEEVEVFAISDILNDLEQISTEDIDLSQITESGPIEAELSLPDGTTMDNNTIILNVELEQTREFEEVPVSVNGSNSQDVTFVNPEHAHTTITVSGNESDVSALTEDDVQLFIDTNDLDDGEHQVPIRIEGPDNVTITVDPQQVTIDVSS